MSLWNSSISLIKPMLAFPSKPFDSKDFIMEIKYDGTRCISYIDAQAKSVLMLNRRMKFFQERYPEIKGLYKQINAKRAILDGELVVLDNGKPNFSLLQEREQSGNKTRIELLSELHPATYIVFDILHKDGEDLVSRPLSERKELLDSVLMEYAYAIKSKFIHEKGIELFERVSKEGLEGIMAKRISSQYVQARSKDWLKIKALNTIDSVILGYTSSDKEALSALLLGAYDNGKLIYIGRVGTGFSEQEREVLLKLLAEQKAAHAYAEIPNMPGDKKVFYTKPVLVAEVKYMELTSDNELRAPSFVALRTDKLPEDCTLESARPVNV